MGLTIRVLLVSCFAGDACAATAVEAVSWPPVGLCYSPVFELPVLQPALCAPGGGFNFKPSLDNVSQGLSLGRVGGRKVVRPARLGFESL